MRQLNAALLFGLLTLASFEVRTQQLPFGDLPPGIIVPSFGCGAANLAAEARTSCLIREVRYADENLNARYQDLQKTVRRDEARALQDTQRAWLKQRDAACTLETRTSDRNQWIRYVAGDIKRANCVVRMMQQRTAVLEEMQSTVGTPAAIATVERSVRFRSVQHPPKEAVFSASSGDSMQPEAKDSDRLLQSSNAPRQGKYYFEVVIDPALNADKVEASLAARVNDGQRWFGASYELRPQDIVLKFGPDSGVRIVGGNLGDIRLPKVVLGIAADLDNGKLYRHRDGIWQDSVVPGSPNGAALPQGAEYKAEVYSTVRLQPLLEQGIVAANFGAKLFTHNPPAGYRGFDAVAVAEVKAATARSIAIFAPGERVAAMEQVQWVQRYWEWVRSFPSGESPSVDATGYRCAAGQSGPVWFLTGSRESKPIRRECEVPEGKVILLPIVNSLAQSSPGKEAACDQLMMTLRQFSSGITDLRLALNGAALDQPARFFQGTGCFRLRDASSGHTRCRQWLLGIHQAVAEGAARARLRRCIPRT